MNKEAVQRLREPAAWVLLAAAGVHLLAGILVLLGGSGKFSGRALSETQDGLFVQVPMVGLLVLAVLLVTWGGTPTPQARTITTGALGVFGGMALFGVICWLSGMLASSFYATALTKLATFLVGAGNLAVIGVGGWFVFTVFQGMQPSRPQGQPQMQQGYGDFGYQPGQQFGTPGGYGQQAYQQYQQYGQQPAQPGAEGQQPGQQPGAQGAPQQQYGEQQYQSYQQYGQQPGQQDYQQYGYQQQPGQPGQQPGHQQPGQPAQSEEEMGEWTRAYGGDKGGAQGPQSTGPQQTGPQGERRPEDGGDWYRDNRPAQ